MGKEFQMAREEEEEQSVLLAITSSGEPISASSIRDQGEEEHDAAWQDEDGEIEDTTPESQGSVKAPGANPSSTKPKRRRRDNQDRKQDRRNERKHKSVRRCAKELGIVYPGSYCDEAATIPHHWMEMEKIHGGSLYKCKKCFNYLWLPLYHMDSWRLGGLVRKYGKDKGYCMYLDEHRPAKLLMAKMVNLRELESTVDNPREFAKIADEILSDREYDKEVSNGKGL